MIHPTYSTILRLINKRFSSKKKLRILDYGCGSGYFLDVFDEGLIQEYEGCDINRESIVQAERKHPRWAHYFYHQKNGKFEQFGREKKMDFVVMIGVIQYLSVEELFRILSLIKKRLKPNGYIFISCSVDRAIYRYTNLVQLFSPHNLVSRKGLVRTLKSAGFTVTRQFERGLILSPVCSQIMGGFDLVDRVLFSTRGTIGPVGNLARSVTNIILTAEYLLPIDFGYTLFIEAGNPTHAKKI